MLHPSTELRFISEQMGYGVFAHTDIPRGTITWVSDKLDRNFSKEQFAAMDPTYQELLEKYCFMTKEGVHVLCWDHARFMNHSCDPTCLAPGYGFEVAIRDIKADEQLTDDYGSLNMANELECHCGTKKCRGRILPSDMLTHGDEWDALIKPAFHLIESVEQPLWHFVDNKPDVQRVVRTKDQPRSCRENYHAT